jgi:hypothetical protein
VVRLLATVLGLALLAGCSEEISGNALPGTDRAQAPSAVAEQPSSTPAMDLDGFVGSWRGSYSCRQGETGLRVDITMGRDGSLSAAFACFPLPSNPDVAAGGFMMIGAVVDGQAVFTVTDWFAQPPGYVMVDLVVTDPPSSDALSFNRPVRGR